MAKIWERSMEREHAYDAIDSERAYQDKTWPEPAVGVPDSILLIEEYIFRARAAWSISTTDTEALNMLRKVAGIAVRCMEHNGSPRREGF